MRLTYVANDDKTARRISDLLGQATRSKMQKSFSGSGFLLSNRTESEQEYGRPLLTPAEVNQLPADDGILMVGGQLPYRARKVRYYLDRRFRGRDKVPAPDRPEDQARELLAAAPNDWEGLRAEPPPVPTEAAPGAGPQLAASAPSFAQNGASSESAPPAADVWAGFFDGRDADAAASDDPGDSHLSDDPDPEGELPL